MVDGGGIPGSTAVAVLAIQYSAVGWTMDIDPSEADTGTTGTPEFHASATANTG